MVLSLTVLAIIFSAVGSVFVLASKVMPHPDSAEAASVRQTAAINRVLEDLELAKDITGVTPNSIEFVLDDRTGDGVPDRMSYTWSGTPGDPLTMSINGSAPATIVEDVQDFTIALVVSAVFF